MLTADSDRKDLERSAFPTKKPHQPVPLRGSISIANASLEILVQSSQRDKAAALRLLRKMLRHPTSDPTERSGASRNWLLGIARARTVRQQSSGELASAAPTTRMKDARLQISQIGSALCFRSCGRLQDVQRATAFGQPSDASTVSAQLIIHGAMRQPQSHKPRPQGVSLLAARSLTCQCRKKARTKIALGRIESRPSSDNGLLVSVGSRRSS